MSPPAWGRGLKLRSQGLRARKFRVAPRVGAWIETLTTSEGRRYENVSPPAWGRGLKRFRHGVVDKHLVSPPAWGRGLKRVEECGDEVRSLASPPAWGRGLKLGVDERAEGALDVAPRVGAWIETISPLPGARNRPVAPRVGAWIETEAGSPPALSPPPSPPAWGRGLKQQIPRGPPILARLSPPAWGRGLKRSNCRELRLEARVAPRVGAWIETRRVAQQLSALMSRPPRGGVD